VYWNERGSEQWMHGTPLITQSDPASLCSAEHLWVAVVI